VVAGAGCGPPAAVIGFAERLGWPLLADPRSGCRTPSPRVAAAADAFLRDPVVRDALLPEVVVVLGAPWVSRPLAGWLRAAADAGAEILAVDPWWRWRDPDHVVSERHRADPARWLQSVVDAVEGSARPASGGAGGSWPDRWTAVEAAAQRAIDGALAGTGGGSARWGEPALARVLPGMLPGGARVLVASSMPVRDLETFAPPLDPPPAVFANRGANGIDGVCSTALGLAATGDGPVVGVVGDLAFLHDVSALVRSPGGPAGSSSCTLVVVDNDGGGIFSFLPQAGAVDAASFDRLFGTPQLPHVAEVARGFGIPVADVDGHEGLAAALDQFVGRAELAVVRASMPSRVENVAVHGRVLAAVGHAAAAALAAG
jgi:2-succinyl-5-enolpyruvyl-6-hydroxy-3-cyclohexene-1-carboxylate synthase